MKKTLKILLLIAAVWTAIPLLYFFIAFPIMDSIADQLEEISLLINIPFVGFFSTLIILGIYRLFLPYFGQYLQHLNSRVNDGQKA